MTCISTVVCATYRALVASPGLPEFFSAATPVEELDRLDVGSPALALSRHSAPTLDDLRPIWVSAAAPWVSPRHADLRRRDPALGSSSARNCRSASWS
ncbi:MAG: phosphoenolpyruvate carboxylase [Actinomycetota bacterium]|nr:phosphoenolpyruvate carboxylase [Actinomycetota bacterium]